MKIKSFLPLLKISMKTTYLVLKVLKMQEIAFETIGTMLLIRIQKILMLIRQSIKPFLKQCLIMP